MARLPRDEYKTQYDNKQHYYQLSGFDGHHITRDGSPSCHKCLKPKDAIIDLNKQCPQVPPKKGWHW